MQIKKKTVDHVFAYHAPTETQVRKYQMIRTMAKHLAVVLLEECPPSRELSTALSNVQEAVMWANASIALNEEQLPQKPVVLVGGPPIPGDHPDTTGVPEPPENVPVSKGT